MSRHSAPTRLFHWIMVVMILVQIPAGIAMTSEGFRGVSDVLYVTHKGLGVLILIVLVARFAWRLVGPPAPPLPDAIPPLERSLARWAHRGLYLLVGAMAVTGYLRTVGGGFPIELLDVLGIPPLVGENVAVATRLSVIHKFLSYLLVAVLALHVGAVVQNTLVVRNGVLWRMWPPWKSGGRP